MARHACRGHGVLEELEETARLWLLSGRRCAVLDEARIAELRTVFGARW